MKLTESGLWTPSGGGGGGVPAYTATGSPTLWARANECTDADGATITVLPNKGSSGALSSVNGTPTIHEGVIGGFKTMRFARASDEYLVYPATTHPNNGSMIAIARQTSGLSETSTIVGLFQSSTERNSMHMSSANGGMVQGWWNNETSWLNAGTLGAVTEDKWYVWGWTWTGTTTIQIDYYRGDTEEVETLQGDNGAEEFNEYRIGQGGSSTSAADADIAEVVVWDTKLSASAILAEMASLASAYSVDLDVN